MVRRHLVVPGISISAGATLLVSWCDVRDVTSDVRRVVVVYGRHAGLEL